MYAVVLLMLMFLALPAYAPTTTVNILKGGSLSTAKIDYLITETVADLIRHTREDPRTNIASDDVVWFTFGRLTYANGQILKPLQLSKQSEDFILAEACSKAELESRIEDKSRQVASYQANAEMAQAEKEMLRKLTNEIEFYKAKLTELDDAPNTVQ